VIEVPLDGQLSRTVIFQNPDLSGELLDPTGDVDYWIYGPGNAAAIKTGTLTKNTADGDDGIFFLNIPASAANGFAAGSMYTLMVGAQVGIGAYRREVLDTIRVIAAAPPTAADVATAVWGAVARTLTANPGLDAAGVRAAVGLAAANTDTQLAAIGGKTAGLPADTAAVLAAILEDTAVIGALGAGLSNVPWNTAWAAPIKAQIDAALATDVIADSVPAVGARPTVKQALYVLVQFMLERAREGTTMTVYKPDGETPLMTLTMDDGGNPTAIGRAT
jgi:hypothetical protein